MWEPVNDVVFHGFQWFFHLGQTLEGLSKSLLSGHKMVTLPDLVAQVARAQVCDRGGFSDQGSEQPLNLQTAWHSSYLYNAISCYLAESSLLHCCA